MTHLLNNRNLGAVKTSLPLKSLEAMKWWRRRFYTKKSKNTAQNILQRHVKLYGSLVVRNLETLLKCVAAEGL